MKTIISTVGTSLLGNLNNPRRNPSGLTDPYDLLRANPQEASAEANAVTRLAQEGDDLVFLHSDTEESERCAAALNRYFAEQGHRTRMERIVGLSYNEKGFVSHGLRELVRLLSREIRLASRSHKPAHLNATGGFKAEIAYATALGLMFGVPVSYIHEKFDDVITLPATPIAWDYSLFAWYRDFFEWIDAEPRPTAEVKTRLTALPDTVALLLEEDGEHTFLSPLGEAYLEAYRGEADQRQKVMLSAQARATLEAQNLSTRTAFLQLLERLRKGEAGDWQRSAETLSGGISKFPKGHSALRAFVTERDGLLHVLELSGHREERRYQELMQTIRWSAYEHGDWSALP
ncbi:hypothetical protein GCM10017783_22870 [Deinococcus piscis]|uniref:CRISPR system ring nuclease SSO1393-like domain-containing protein n=1 Tax=Deinococcus piscis TaxID=394230 RepID=A0ABQ3KCS3_9DEIO|nr:putative CRISPR-associated protein [Deinococcus piscis]GHG09783.1 hypothetical protein GCM10017783_22870 [Deinococcus piscis]